MQKSQYLPHADSPHTLFLLFYTSVIKNTNSIFQKHHHQQAKLTQIIRKYSPSEMARCKKDLPNHHSHPFTQYLNTSNMQCTRGITEIQGGRWLQSNKGVQGNEYFKTANRSKQQTDFNVDSITWYYRK